MSADHLYPAHTGLLYDRHMCKDMFDDSLYILCTYLLYTMYILSTYLQTTANAGFRGARRDEDIQAGGPVSTQPHVTDDAEGDDNPCTEDEEFFQGRPDADDMEEAITKFLDGMEGQECSGFKDLHRFLGSLPLPVAKGDSAILHSEALEGGFIPKMDEEEQKRCTPSELLLYKHALEYRYFVHTLYIHSTYKSIYVHTWYIIVHTRAYLFKHCTYMGIYVHTLYIQGTY